MKKKGRG